MKLRLFSNQSSASTSKDRILQFLGKRSRSRSSAMFRSRQAQKVLPACGAMPEGWRHGRAPAHLRKPVTLGPRLH
eukprot:12875845-Prorocentrum_lima.AAC.1